MTHHSRSPRYLLLKLTPSIVDPKELNSIISASLRSLYGDTAALHVFEVIVCAKGASSSKRESEAILRCDSSSIDAIRAALTLVTPPHYLKDTIYRIDCVRVADSFDALSQEAVGNEV